MRKERSSPSASEGHLSQGARKMERPLLAAKRKDASSQHRQKQRRALRAAIAVVAGRAVGALSRRLHLGGGTSIMGVVAQRIYPDILEHLSHQLEHGCVIVTGTNGKTTTSSFLAAILQDVGLRVWRNREGSNLMRGIASALVIRARPDGLLRRSGRAIAIFEIDEAALPQLARLLPIRVAVFTNLFRDQLDRYGEVDSVISYWRKAIELLPPSTILVLNADDPAIAALGNTFTGEVLYYGIDDLSLDLPAQDPNKVRHQVVDASSCPRCGSPYEYDVRFYSHVGHYHCANCGNQRPQAQIRALQVQQDSFDRLRVQILANEEQRELVIPLAGLYNIYNALAAIAAASALNVDWEPIITGIEQSKPVFGRGERVQAEGRTLRLLLAKNPTGFNEVLRTLFSNGTQRHMLFVLNDNTADGRDISWIWDVNFEQLVGKTQTLILAGTRARDLALRMKYAGVAQNTMTIIPPAPLRATQEKGYSTARTRGGRKRMQPAEATSFAGGHLSQPQGYGIKKALDVALHQTPVGETLFIVPTYTGLLEVHRELEQRGFTPHYWEDKH